MKDDRLHLLHHDYLGVNQIRVWEIVENYLPDLKQKITAIQRELDAGSNDVSS